MTIARFIDHSLLSPTATAEDIDILCAEALEFGFAGVCVNAAHIEQVAKRLAGSDTVAVAVVGFPLGATTTEAKVFEAREAARRGAGEIDAVVALGLLKARDYRGFFEDLAAVVRAVDRIPVKAILEMGALSPEEKIAACALAQAAGAQFVKTSTGYGAGGATVEDVALMRRLVGPGIGVKASGGIRTREQAEAMLAAGATRLGTSASVAIVRGVA